MSEKRIPLDQLNYEQAFDELTGIVNQLENGQTSLEESMAIFQRGQALASRCTTLLDQAELTIETLTAEQLLPPESEDEE
jgi:exodeoxyribonuclease VII small subunit